ncbi:helix-turn-helix domain-containing protein [Kitasatospora sp. NPDC048239]|uniref:ArsR/SmtB family transcription factor n=1 Tax=Kitasatospora sp. NPDC048239 TaxID=3364046 RepID=UPI0037188BA9
MIRFHLDVEDLTDTRFAISPLQEVMGSLWALRDPGRFPLHRPWRGSVLDRIDASDLRLLLSLVGESRALPDFLTPRPSTFAPVFEEQLAVVRRTPLELVRRDLLATHAPGPLPEALRAATAPGSAPVRALLHALCELLQRYWELALRPVWPQLRLVLEGDVTYRARQLATGGARLLFSDLHPNLRWHGGVLHIDRMIGRHQVAAGGRGLPLVPSVFAYKPVPPLDRDEPPMLTYPSRGIATLWPGPEAPAPEAPAPSALSALLGAPRARLLTLLAEPLTTGELARRLGVTPSAVSQHLRALHATGLLTRIRDGRHVLYRRSPLGDQLTGLPSP